MTKLENTGMGKCPFPLPLPSSLLSTWSHLVPKVLPNPVGNSSYFWGCLEKRPLPPTGVPAQAQSPSLPGNLMKSNCCSSWSGCKDAHTSLKTKSHPTPR